METSTKFEAKAVQRHLRKAPRKIRLVADLVRGLRVDKALKQLEFIKKGTALDVAKVVNSAAHNLRNKFDEERLDDDLLYIKEISVDKGVTLKRMRPRAQGRGARINKHSSHITVVVAKQQEIVTE